MVEIKRFAALDPLGNGLQLGRRCFSMVEELNGIEAFVALGHKH